MMLFRGFFSFFFVLVCLWSLSQAQTCLEVGETCSTSIAAQCRVPSLCSSDDVTDGECFESPFGKSCSTNEDCPPIGNQAFECVSREELGNGKFCLPLNFQFPNGFNCKSNEICASNRCRSGRCVGSQDIGSTCQQDDDCVDEAFCNSTSDVCEARVGNGQPCDTVQDNCLQGHTCDGREQIGTCVPSYSKPNGASCYYGSACQSGYCSCSNLQCADGTTVSGLNTPCTTFENSSDTCGSFYLHCIEGRCALKYGVSSRVDRITGDIICEEEQQRLDQCNGVLDDRSGVCCQEGEFCFPNNPSGLGAVAISIVYQCSIQNLFFIDGNCKDEGVDFLECLVDRTSPCRQETPTCESSTQKLGLYLVPLMVLFLYLF